MIQIRKKNNRIRETLKLSGQDGLAGAGDRGQGHMPGDWH